MDEELGKWLLDISKYIITAYILAEMFGKDNDSILAVVGAVVLAAASFVGGLYLIKKGKIKKIRKENNMDTGLLIMYIFVAIIIVGSLVYSRLEDKKGK